MSIIEKLNKIRSSSGSPLTYGLSDEKIISLSKVSPSLSLAVDSAISAFEHLQDSERQILLKNEQDLIDEVQAGYVNFYAKDAVQPFIALAAYGPWIISAYGSVIYESGGYGMLGLGHNPLEVHRTLGRSYVMANIMTPSLQQLRFINKLRENIGFKRSASMRHPYQKFICLNSGSESMTMALRISDLNAAVQLGKNGKHQGKKTKYIALKGGFHGRTDQPAQISDSCLAKYRDHLASFMNRDNLIIVEPNDCKDLKAKWEDARLSGVFIEAIILEPVMGEGNPGLAITPDFYALARKLSEENDAVFIVDSIQAGFRAHGCLSVTDFPGFENLAPPDMETYSKAINAGQYPLSVLALGPRVVNLYKTGIYGNTMTTNPRALEIACTVLDQINETMRKNIVQKGHELLEKFKKLNKELGGAISRIEGTGLLFACHFDKKRLPVLGVNGLEYKMRLRGINVIHGGENALRFTPQFAIASWEIDLIIDTLKEAILAS